MRLHGYFFFIWFLLQVGNAKPEIQKVVDALNSIQTKVIYAVLDTTSHNCMIQKVDFWISLLLPSGSVHFFPVHCIYGSKINLHAISMDAPVILNAKEIQTKL